jgi:hypothetical protein
MSELDFPTKNFVYNVQEKPYFIQESDETW